MNAKNSGSDLPGVNPHAAASSDQTSSADQAPSADSSQTEAAGEPDSAKDKKPATEEAETKAKQSSKTTKGAPKKGESVEVELPMNGGRRRRMIGTAMGAPNKKTDVLKVQVLIGTPSRPSVFEFSPAESQSAYRWFRGGTS